MNISRHPTLIPQGRPPATGRALRRRSSITPPSNPDIKVEVEVDNTLLDLVAGRYDVGVRLGEQVAKAMVAERIKPDIRMAVVGAPSYFARHDRPKTPQDLTAHSCINLRLPILGGLYAWELEKAGRKVRVRVDGSWSSTFLPLLKAALAGLGLACVFEDLVQEHLVTGQFVRMLADWCPPFPGYHLNYPSRRQPTPVFVLFVDALRYRG